MSALSMSQQESWLGLKHRTPKASVYGFACGDRDSDWDFADVPSRGAYAFHSEDSPIQLLNNSGGMDEDDVSVKDVWYPQHFQQHQQTIQSHQQHESPEAHDADSDMGESMSSGDDEMDMEMTVVDQTAQQQFAFQQQQQLQLQQQQFQHEMLHTQHRMSCPQVNKKKRGFESFEMSSGMGGHEMQQFSMDSTIKKMKVGA